MVIEASGEFADILFNSFGAFIDPGDDDGEAFAARIIFVFV